jgi:hypothetical protein
MVLGVIYWVPTTFTKAADSDLLGLFLAGIVRTDVMLIGGIFTFTKYTKMNAAFCIYDGITGHLHLGVWETPNPAFVFRYLPNL